MSTVELIKNAQGLPFARIKEIGGKLILETINPAKILGRYDPKTNLTTDYGGRKVGNGNVLTTLLTSEILQRQR